MAKTTRHVLENSLEDLGKEQMKKFIGRLVDPEREEPRVKRSAVEDPTDRVCVVNAIVGTYTEAGAGGVVVEILRGMNYNEDAKRLEAKLEELKRMPSQPSANRRPTSPPSTAQPVVHFVDQHRSDLIQRICNISSILDKLLDHRVLSQEQYDFIRAKATRQEKARELCSGALMSSGTRGKDIFYNVLEELEPFLIEDLKRS